MHSKNKTFDWQELIIWKAEPTLTDKTNLTNCFNEIKTRINNLLQLDKEPLEWIVIPYKGYWTFREKDSYWATLDGLKDMNKYKNPGKIDAVEIDEKD